MSGQNRNNRKNNFIVHAGILAAAGIISRIIGLLYRSPLTGIIGDEGNGYYTSAFYIYTIILLISSYSIPAAVSKVIAQKLAVREYRNAHRIFICSLWYVIVVGGAASLFVFFFGDLLVKGEAAAVVLKVFAPTIFFSGLLGVLRGYFQAHKTMLQTSVSQVLEQLLNAVVSILAAYLFISLTLGSMEIYKADGESGQVTFGEETVTGQPQGINDVLGIYGENQNKLSEEEADTGISSGDGGFQDTVSGNLSSGGQNGGTDNKDQEEQLLTKEQKEWNTKHALYGAAGSALGTGIGVFVALLFMYGIYLLNRKTIMRRVSHDHTGLQDSYSDILKLLLAVVTPFILSTAIYNSSTVINQTIYIHIMMSIHNLTEAEAYTLYGIYGGKAVVISNIPIALASAMSTAMLPSIAEHFAKKELKQARSKVTEGIRMTMLIAIPSAVGLAVLAKPITQVLFWQRDSLDLASGLLRALAVSVVFYTLSTLTNAVLQGIGKINLPVVNAAGALVIQTVILVPLLLFTDWSLYALALSNVVYSATMCILNGIAVKKHLKYRQEVINTYIIPLVAAVFMGATAFGVYYGLNYLVPSNIICLAAAIAVSATVYFVLVIKFGGIREEELRRMPKGYMIVKVAKKLRLM